MKYAISPTPQFERDYRRAAKKGLDMAPLNAVIAALAAGELLPPENRDRPLGGELYGYRECRVLPDRLLVYRIDGDVLLLHLIRTGTQGELYRKGGTTQMKNGMKSLYRSPVKTAVTLLLLAAAAFLFLYNLGEYNVSDREYREARDKYEGVLTVEEQSVPDNPSYFDYFLMTDDTNPGNSYEQKYEDNHQQRIGEDVIAKLSALPYISRVEKRYLTAGVSPAYIRLDTDQNVFPYFARCILIATVKYRYQSSVYNAPQVIEKYTPYIENMEYITLENVELLAGDSSWLHGQERQTLYVQTIKEENREDH